MSASNSGRVVVVGASGSGKSAYVKRYVGGQGRVLALDPMDEYSAQGFKRCTSVEQVRAAMRVSFKRFKIAYVPKSADEMGALNRLSHLALVAQQPWRGKKGPELVLVVEEMNTCFPLHKASKVPAFAEVCSRGRHSHIHVVGVTQRLAEIDTRFRGNLTEAVVFRQTAPVDVRAVVDATGTPANRVSALKKLEYLQTKEGQITPGVLTFPKKKRGK